MKMKQIAAIVNTMAAETTGETGVVTEDLTGVVDAGQAITDKIGWEQFTNTIVDKIGRVIMVNREYDSAAPDILRRGTGIPFGSITEKIRVKLPAATQNDSWPIGETWTPGAGWNANDKPTNDDANPFITVRPELEATYFNGGGTYEVDMTFPTIQMRSGFQTPEDYRRFFDMVENRIYQSKTVFKDNLTKRTINNFVGVKLNAGNAVVDLLAMYNAAYGQTVTPAQALYNPAFLRYAGYIMGLYRNRLRRMSRLYNMAEYDTFTPGDRLRWVVLDMFANAIETFMESDTYHNELVGLGAGYSTIDSWQGNGNTTGVDFATAASLNITTDVPGETEPVTINTATMASGSPLYVVGTMFDVEAAWQDYDNPRVTSQYNARKEQTTFFYKEDVHYCNDFAENGVVFTLGTPASNQNSTTSTRKK